jgi:hypothetical protein
MTEEFTALSEELAENAASWVAAADRLAARS